MKKYFKEENEESEYDKGIRFATYQLAFLVTGLIIGIICAIFQYCF